MSPTSNSVLQSAYEIIPNVPGSCCELYYAAHPNGVVLGSLGPVGSDDEHTTSMALVNKGTWTSIWTETVNLPPSAFRDIARFAGVHIYSNADDVLYANKSYVALDAHTAGTKTIRFPRPVSVYDGMTGALLKNSTASYSFRAQVGDVNIFRYQ